MRGSVLDLGSNSFHLLVADVDPPARVDAVHRQREMLHLGRVVARHGHLPTEHVRRATAEVARLSARARDAGATTRVAVATAALRDAANSTAVVADLAAAAGHPVRVLSGDEEARLAYHGVRAALGDGDGPLAVFDLGGGSLELAVGTGEEPHLVTSCDIGASRLSALVASDPISAADRGRVRDAVATELARAGGAFATPLPPRVAVIGGTVRAMARLVADPGAPTGPHGVSVTLARLRGLRDGLCALGLAGRVDVPGLPAARADHLHVAAIALVEVLQRLRVEQVDVCDWGLREGVLLEAAA